MDWKNILHKRPRKFSRPVSVGPGVFSLRVGISLFLIFALLTGSLPILSIEQRVFAADVAKSSARTLSPQSGDTVVFYGPRQFVRQSGSPVTVTEQFTIPFGVVAPYTIQVQNGAANGTHRVSSATIQLNGVELFAQNAIKDSTPSLSQTVSLQTLNELKVKLTSAAGSFLTISIVGTRTVLPPASLLSVNPTRATQGQTLNVTLHGENTHWVQGVTRASFGPEVSVNGAAMGELGTVSVSNFTTATAQITISATAALAPRTVRVVTPNVPAPFPLNIFEETVTLADAFTVTATSPPGPSSTTVTTIVGLAGNPGFADGVASQARFQNPTGIAVGPDDSIYVADSGNNRIRLVRLQPDSFGNLQWIVSTLAGNGTYGFVDGPAATAQFRNPQGVAIDSSGAVFVADSANNRIRKIGTNGTVSTVAGDGTPGLVDGTGSQARFNSPRGIAVDIQGNIYVADTGNAAVRKIDLAGQVSTLAGDGTVGSSDSPSRFDCPSGVAVSGSTVYVYLADKGNHRIRSLDSTGTVVTIAGQDRGFADGSAGDARFAEPSGIAVDASGNIIVTDAVNSLIRQVSRVPAGRGFTIAVSTLAGSGERGFTDGPGSLSAFLTPRGVASTSSSAIIVADTGNHTLRRLTLPPVILSTSPASARPGETITIDGARFDARGTDQNTVRFTKAPELGGGNVTATVISATQTTLLVTVPDEAATGPITVQTEGGTAVSPLPLEVLPPIPVITSFSPHAGAIGSAVTLSGQWLKAYAGETTVTFAGRGNTRLPALVTFASLSQVNVVVPNAAVTGPIELSNVWGQTATNEAFTVNASQDFQLTVAPATATAIQQTSATYVVQLTSTQTSFTQLARLSVTGLPAGVTATLTPSQITAGASSTLSLNLTNANLTPGSYLFTLSGAADIDGNETVRTVQLSLSVVAAGQTTLSGRVMSTDNEPIIGATISVDGHSATTNAAGSFLLTGVNAGPARPVMIDGRTANSPNRTYPVLAEPANIVAGQANIVPYVFYLPPIDVENEVILVPGQTTVVTTPRVPGLQLTVPAGANLRNRDNTPVTRISITPVPIDRTPTPLPPNVTTGMVYTNQPGGAISDAPMPMVFPNLMGADPGTRAELYAFNHDTVQWYVYGYGRVSADGRLVVPEINPATGQPYGLVDFSWYFVSADPDGDPGDPCPCPSNRTGNPVDLSTGIKIENATDVSFGGARGRLALTRVFTSDLNASDAGFSIIGRFGRGTKDNYDVTLTGTFGPGGAGRVVFPEQRTGHLFSYVRTDPDGAFVFASTSVLSQQGDVVRQKTDGTFEYRYSGGELLRFDSSRRLVATIDRNGNTTTLSYNGSKLTSITDPVGRSLTLEYNSLGLVERLTDPLQRHWLYTYKESPFGYQLETVTDPLENVVQYTYDEGPLVMITDGRNNLVKQISYNVDSGRVLQQTFADGGFERYQYAVSGTVVTGVTITDSLGRTESKRFNAAGYVIGLADGQGQFTSINRDIATNRSLSTFGSCGCAEATNEFDERGNRTGSTNRLGQTGHWEYGSVFNNVTRSIDPLGHETTFGYDSRGNLTTVTNALNQTATFAYDGFGQLTSITDPLNHTTTLEYDSAGNVVGIVDALNHRATFEYDALGRLKAAIDPLNRRQSVTYDALDRILSTTDATNAVTAYTYDANGNITSLTNSLQKRWQWVHDAKNRPLSVTDPLNRVKRYTYNTEDELVEIKSPLNRTVKYAYDNRGQLSTITDSLNNVVHLSYDNRGNLNSLVDQRGFTTTYSFDELGRPISSRNPLGQFTDVSYDAANNITSFTDQKGRRTNIVFDKLNRPLNITYPDAVATFTYDAAGRTTQVSDTQGGSVTWSYDEANRLLSETSPAGVVTYAYNAANQRTSMTAANAVPVTYGYDNSGRLETITQGAEIFTFAYDTLSRLSSLQRPNGVRTSIAYDEVSRLKQLRHSDALNQTIEDYRYTYTLDDQISSITSLGPPQLLPAARNVSSADAANRITQSGSAHYSFDETGQATTKTDEQGVTTYQWDARGRLSGAALPSGQTVNYGYDALGRRASRSTGGTTTNFLYDGGDVVRDSDSSSNTIDYLNGPGVDNKLRQSSAGAGTFYFLQDHLGSTRALTNGSGAVVEQSQYEAYGHSSGSALTRYGFTGRELDDATGLTYNRARWYDSNQGRFLTEDPIGFAGGLNSYGYVANDPLSFIDPTGLSLQTFLDGFWRSFAVSAVVAAVVAGIIAASGGTVAAVIAALAAVYGGYQLYQAIKELATANLCPDEYDEKLGELIGGILGGLVGGGVGSGIGARVGRVPGFRSFMADESGMVPGRIPGDYLVGKAPKQVTPGTRVLEGQYVNDLGRVEPWKAYYDEYGRMVARTDYNAGNKAAGIPDTHHSQYEYNARYPNGRETNPHTPGPFPGLSFGCN
ncbi:MAG TPA: RHS repeat-associated core domain-containing protein [Pyrinomonadaceae bacterium]|nr:RHS repeat-associated core domain-containing protein [Pyrinomonadaceae bacterium]